MGGWIERADAIEDPEMYAHRREEYKIHSPQDRRAHKNTKMGFGWWKKT